MQRWRPVARHASPRVLRTLAELAGALDTAHDDAEDCRRDYVFGVWVPTAAAATLFVAYMCRWFGVAPPTLGEPVVAFADRVFGVVLCVTPDRGVFERAVARAREEERADARA